ncbi:GUN4 domain-containing protein [Nostoc sp.]|uniref:GUN4 domain-containing protein n=1 Tax=Nostoc sp. TaxID=1180 RepID=UPI002FFB044B
MTNFDVFLAHNSLDKPEVRAIAEELKRHNLKPWLDEDQILGGDRILQAIFHGILQSKAGALFISLNGLGNFQESIELDTVIQSFLEKHKSQNFRVIPVLLPGISDVPDTLWYLRQWRWIKFTHLNDEAALQDLIRSIRGRKPNAQEPSIIKILDSPFIIQPQPPQNALELLNSHLGVQPNISAIEAVEHLKPYLDTQPQPTQTDDLASEKGIDYTRLRDLLVAQEWEQADEETYQVMIKVLGKNKGHIFTVEEMKSFPCTDLHTIDNLWVKHSAGHFGFSIQQKIYLSVGDPLDGDFYQDIWRKFGDKIGWRVNEIWICGCDEDEEINFDISSPEGHLPVVSGKLEGKVIIIFSRIDSY